MAEFQTYPSATETHLFSDGELVQYQDATTSQRFVNFLVDAILMEFGLAFATGYLLTKVLMLVSPESTYDWLSDESFLTSYVVGLFNHIIYYTFCEKAFRGYTLGKLITGTRAVREDGGELTLRNAFLRSLSRIVPFETLSIWFGDGGPWHDKWTNTRVIKAR
ncbi:MAG TPA: RDD family protein [Flavisolibacter sp.]|jgi:uncharacterized RDD family membrane protein YckC|nr:RDD family protein [Flavisolibacter sp.]